MAYTKENLDNYKKLNDELSEAQNAFTKRACEVFHRIFSEYLSKYDLAFSDENIIEATCLDRLGIAKQQYHDRVEAEQAKEEWYDQEVPDPLDEPNIKKLYCYEIKLHKTFPLHQDPEYGKNRYYVNQNIPPKFIKYTSWIEVLA